MLHGSFYLHCILSDSHIPRMEEEGQFLLLLLSGYYTKGNQSSNFPRSIKVVSVMLTLALPLVYLFKGKLTENNCWFLFFGQVLCWPS